MEMNTSKEDELHRRYEIAKLGLLHGFLKQSDILANLRLDDLEIQDMRSFVATLQNRQHQMTTTEACLSMFKSEVISEADEDRNSKGGHSLFQVLPLADTVVKEDTRASPGVSAQNYLDKGKVLAIGSAEGSNRHCRNQREVDGCCFSTIGSALNSSSRKSKSGTTEGSESNMTPRAANLFPSTFTIPKVRLSSLSTMR